ARDETWVDGVDGDEVGEKVAGFTVHGHEPSQLGAPDARPFHRYGSRWKMNPSVSPVPLTKVTSPRAFRYMPLPPTMPPFVRFLRPKSTSPRARISPLARKNVPAQSAATPGLSMNVQTAWIRPRRCVPVAS